MNYIKTILSFALILAMLTNTSIVALANTQEIQGSEDKSQTVEVIAEVKSVYSVSLPANIELTYSELSNVYMDNELHNDAVEGYWGTIVYGCAGKISSTEYVYIEPVFPCTLTGETSGETITLKKVLPSSKEEPKTQWSSTEIGSCTYDGVTLTNCQYSYCSGLQIGFKQSDITKYETYKGTLTFQFGVDSN